MWVTSQTNTCEKKKKKKNSTYLTEGRWKNKLLYVKTRTRERMLRKCLTDTLEGSAESTGIELPKGSLLGVYNKKEISLYRRVDSSTRTQRNCDEQCFSP